VKTRVDLAESAELHSRVNLRRGNRCMTEHFLHNAQIRPSGEQVSRKAVTKRMWAHFAAGTACLSYRFTTDHSPIRERGRPDFATNSTSVSGLRATRAGRSWLT
jgi:hypothetical protein